MCNVTFCSRLEFIILHDGIYRISTKSGGTFAAAKRFDMTRFVTLFLGILCFWPVSGQEEGKSLDWYLANARENSPLIKDYADRKEIAAAERQRLKVFYTHSKAEVNGDLLFVPIVSMDGGKAAFRWNAHDAVDYYGYDLGESSGYLHGGVTWTKPLLGGGLYKTAAERADLDESVATNEIRLEEHSLERLVTEQYLLCLLDKAQIAFADSVGSVFERQVEVVSRLVSSGMASRSDLRLLEVENEANNEARVSALQSYQSHLVDLNLVCGVEVRDEGVVSTGSEIGQLLPDADVQMTLELPGTQSGFMERYRLDSLNVEVGLRAFNTQYKPRLDMFMNGGLQVGAASNWYRHFGWSAGLTFTWTFSDGGQKRQMERQAWFKRNTIRNYKDNFEYQRRMRLNQCLSELARNNDRKQILENQLNEYDEILSEYSRKLQVGQVSVHDYLMVLRNRINVERDLLVLDANRKLAITAYNYWCW